MFIKQERTKQADVSQSQVTFCCNDFFHETNETPGLVKLPDPKHHGWDFN